MFVRASAGGPEYQCCNTNAERHFGLHSVFERLLLVVDQFEELFTSTPPSLRRGFAEALVHLQERDNVCVLLTLRADFYSQAISLSRMLSDQLRRAVVNVGAMSREELARAMTKPAADAGICFQPGLVDTILADVGDEAGTLPLLEFAKDKDKWPSPWNFSASSLPRY